MSKRLLYAIKSILIAALFASVLSGCGALNVSDTYPLESVNKEGSQTSYVYRAEGKTVPVVAAELIEQKKPKQQSKEDPDHMFLVYSDQWIHIQKDEKKPEDSLVEVDSEEYVKRNYNPSFLEGYIVGSLISSMFDSLGGGYGNYRGYSSKEIYKPSKQYHTPSAQEKKAIPPMTVERNGSIFKRGSTSNSGKTSDDGGFFGKKPSSGKITKGDKSSGWGSLFSPSKSKPPKTKSGFGKIFKRSRR